MTQPLMYSLMVVHSFQTSGASTYPGTRDNDNRHCQLVARFLRGVMNHLELFPLLPIPLTGILNLGRHGSWRRFPAELGRLKLFRRP